MNDQHLNTVPVDVFHRGQRDYIQGSLMLSTVVESLLGGGAIDCADAHLSKVRFKRILNSNLAYVLGQYHEPDSLLGEFVLVSGGRTLNVSLIEDRQRSREVPRVADAPSRLSRYQHLAQLECEAEFLPFECFDDVLCTVVETVKRCIAESYPSGRNIWFAALQRGNLGPWLANDARVGVVRVADGKVTASGGRYMVSSKVQLNLADGRNANTEVIFTFQESAAGP
jgi:hypothetical protein